MSQKSQKFTIIAHPRENPAIPEFLEHVFKETSHVIFIGDVLLTLPLQSGASAASAAPDSFLQGAIQHYQSALSGNAHARGTFRAHAESCLSPLGSLHRSTRQAAARRYRALLRAWRRCVPTGARLTVVPGPSDWADVLLALEGLPAAPGGLHVADCDALDVPGGGGGGVNVAALGGGLAETAVFPLLGDLSPHVVERAEFDRRLALLRAEVVLAPGLPPNAPLPRAGKLAVVANCTKQGEVRAEPRGVVVDLGAFENELEYCCVRFEKDKLKLADLPIEFSRFRPSRHPAGPALNAATLSVDADVAAAAAAKAAQDTALDTAPASRPRIGLTGDVHAPSKHSVLSNNNSSVKKK